MPFLYCAFHAAQRSLRDFSSAVSTVFLMVGYTGAEHDAAFETFKANVAFIHEHNKDAEKHGFTVALNQFADMTRQEFKKTMLTYQAERKKALPVKMFDTTA